MAYQNLYPNNPYYATSYQGYNNMYGQQPYQMQQQYQPTQIQQTGLPGKIVESLDMAKNTEIPIGSTAIFPQADMNKIFVKSWGADGSIKIVTYSPEKEKEQPSIDATITSSLNDIYESITNLEKKIDKIRGSSSPTPMKRKEVKQDE